MGRSRNHLDHLRLLFAALVIFSHSFHLTLGEGTDPVEVLFPGAALGGLAVQGFFVLSGYLIAASWLSNPRPIEYLRNRVLRIVPAFAVAFVLCVLLAVGVGSRLIVWPRLAWELATLHAPTAPIPGRISNDINGAMWTIQWEFACYLVAPLAVFRPIGLAALWLCAAVVAVLTPDAQATWVLMFLSGAAVRVFDLKPGLRVAGLCGALAVASLLNPWTRDVGMAAAGSVALVRVGLIPARRTLPDISYGLYLYGWPVQQVMIMLGLTAPWLLFPAALVVAGLCGAVSWFGIERHALKLKRWRPTGATTSPATA